jgi:DNA-binding NarL/FixJ family response regulator
MFKLKCAILDDEARAIRAIEYMIGICKHAQVEFHLEKTSQHPDEILNEAFLSQIDVVFLDIKLADKNGLSLFKELESTQTKVVIVSAYDEYALEAIKASVFDYLVKPVEEEDFRKMMDRLAASYEQSFKQMTELIHFSQSLHADGISEKTHQQITRVNETIISDIKNRYPHLTQSDYRLLALVYLGYSTKEIAIHLHIEPESVKKAKFRLRKKLGLSKEQGIEEVFVF